MINRRLILLYAVLMLCCQVCSLEILLGRGDLKPNTEMLHQVLQKSLGQVIHYLPKDTPVAVSVHFPGYEWFMYHRFVEILADSGYSVSQNVNDPAGRSTLLEVGVEEFGVDYMPVKRGSIFRARRILRHAKGTFSFRITDGSTEQIIRATEQVSDTIPYKKREQVENRALPFTLGDVPEGSITDRYLGPAVIITATGIVVYLFFSIRS